MGVGPGYVSGSSSRYSSYKTPKKSLNPDPKNFRVLFEILVGTYLVAMVLYPDAVNFEGVKVLLFNGPVTVKNFTTLDPHFSKDSKLIARFLPDENGWEMAIKVAGMLSSTAKTSKDYKD